jgi:hypothetical protein
MESRHQGQALKPGLLDHMGQASQISAWGKKTGDHSIADMRIYSPPGFITQ